MQRFSIKFRLSVTFFLLLFLVVFLGAFSLMCLSDFEGIASQIRDRWLPNTRFLGDLNNYTSDFRAAEGTLLLATSQADIAQSEQEMNDLGNKITKAQQGYEQIYHNDKESDLYAAFSQAWARYKKIVNQSLTLVHAQRKEEAAALYKTTSQSAYNAASDTLGVLTDLNVAEDEQASDQAAQTYSKVRLLTEAAMVLGALLVTVGIMYIRQSISNPILALVENMHHLANNDMDVAIGATERRDEIGEMARAVVVFRNNTVDLALSREGLIQQASMLEEKLEHERNLMSMQRNFITMASHEFRTPLNIIDGHAQRLLKTKSTAVMEDITERAGKIRASVRQMTDLIDNLINSARLFESNPELYFHPAAIDLATVLHEVCHLHREIVPSTPIVENITSPLQMQGDAKLLQQLFGNLLSNAIKYSPDGGLIEMSAVSDAEHITVVVRDHGIGIPQKEHGAVFERYARGSNATNISGTGIGLYLARMVAQLHGGDIAVSSVENEGATFTVRLPRSRVVG